MSNVNWEAVAKEQMKIIHNKLARITELEEALTELYVISGPVANCAYNVGQQHEDWDNIKQYIDKLDKARLDAVNVFKENE